MRRCRPGGRKSRRMAARSASFRFLRSATGWRRVRSSSYWNRSSRRTSNRGRSDTDRNGQLMKRWTVWRERSFSTRRASSTSTCAAISTMSGMIGCWRKLAYAVRVDPVELRLRNDAETDPYSGRPFSTRALRECLTKGAAGFGWDKRAHEPRSMRDGRYLIGQGMAAAIYTHWRWPGKARVTLNGDGSALVEAAAHDIGTGAYTVMAQVAADALGLTPDRVTVRLGDTRLPESHPAIGSSTTANATAAVMLAGRAAREKAVELAFAGRDAPFAGAAPGDVIAGDGRLSLAGTNLNITYAELLARNGLSNLVGDGDYDPVEEANGPRAIFSFSAVFAEVRVDPDFGLVRLNRFVGAYDGGRIINPKTARSQAIGGVIWGVGQALLEQSETDPTLGRFINRNYSGYLVPTNADIPELDVLFVGDFDEEASQLGAKGLGELTAVSVAPAIANAVYHATGKRIRDLPITIEKIMAR